MTDPRFYEAFDDCLTRLLAGESLEDCLQHYSDLAGELRPMLEVAHKVRGSGQASEPARLRSRARFLTTAAQLNASNQSWAGGWQGLIRRALPFAATVLLAALLSTTGLYYASASTAPGDALYPVKRTFEALQLQLADEPAERFALEQEFAGRREAEIKQVLSQTRTATVNFEDKVIALSPTQWQIGGFVVRVDAQTQIIGDPQPGWYVSVAARSESGALTAVEIRSQENDVSGSLVREGDRWAISGLSFAVVAETKVVGVLESGAVAVARVRSLSAGDRIATSVEILKAATPTTIQTATALPQVQLSSTPSPGDNSETLGPSKTKEPSNTVGPKPPTETLEPATTPDSGSEDGGDNSGSGGGDDGGGDDHGGGH